MADSGENNPSTTLGASKSEAASREEAILNFWREKNIFAKSLEKKSPKGEFVFYEGPPTANGKPGIHHLEARAFKDAIPRYKTMQGFHVRRKAGWDTHGLPVELQVEKKLGLKSKKEIEEYGIAKFNQECKESVWEYVDLWEKFTDRIGYWLDRENAYVTYHNEYIESVWNVIKEADNQKLLYKDYKVVPWCPRCGTALSSHELAQGYETVKDLSVYAKFRVVNEPATYILAWTTTPWTLPGNLALAVGEKIDYVKVKVPARNASSIADAGGGEEFYILAKNRLSVMENYEIVSEMKGKDLVGLEYEPLYPFLKAQNPAGIEKAYKVYAADFVTTEDGTGIVHTAVMYGQDDFELGTKVGLPKFHLVNPEGKFIDGTGFLAGRFVRPARHASQGDAGGDGETAVEIIKDLAHRGLLFKKEKYEHDYPFCWRCKTALIYYARDSWYIRMSDPKIKNKLISENQKINWEPTHIRDGRFGEWLCDLKDWAISRERYWGTPLPVWLAEDGEKLVIGSVEELKKYTKKSGNKYFVIRHGGTEGNQAKVISYKNQATDNLTKEGERQTKNTAEKLRKEKIDLIVTSHFTRTKETAETARAELGLPKDAVITDARLCEINPGDLDGKSWDEYHFSMANTGPNWFGRKIYNAESLYEVKKRTAAALYELETKYQNKNILLVTHGCPAWLLFVNSGLFEPDHHEYQPADTNVFIKHFRDFKNAEVRELPFVPLPHNENYDADFHRPFIDEVALEKDGKEFRRVKEVMDVWLDSGAMPFAQDHYPFDPELKRAWYGVRGQKLLYPADYISEAIDQTRGWFYTLHAVGALMGKGLAYKNVICLGHLLDAKGKKMSKSLGNIVDPWEMTHKYGADTLRLWMYSVNQPGESKNFDEKTVLELQRQVFGLLYNVLAFYELYKPPRPSDTPPYQGERGHILDRWVLTRLNELTKITTESLENYKLLEPVRAMKDFINDLSTWYLRRSRERIKDEAANPAKEDGARQTLYHVLKTLAKLMAPFAPFAAEDIWQRLKNEQDEESVHLAEWPTAGKVHTNILEFVGMTREVVSLGLQARQKAGIQVRQPLSMVEIDKKLDAEYLELIKDELNVKEVVVGQEFKLTTELTTQLRMEGEHRELMRQIQDMRKQQGLKPSDKLALPVEMIYRKYKIFPRLEMHQLRVAAVAKMICDNYIEPVNKDTIILSALFHDMGNIVKVKDVNYFGDYDAEEAKYWEEVKREFLQKYGPEEHEGTLKILKEIRVSEKIYNIVSGIDFHLVPDLTRKSLESKISAYADCRVAPYGVVSYGERFREGKERYKDQKDIFTDEQWAVHYKVMNEVEKEIFSKCKIKPEDITDEAVAPIIEELKKFVIK